MHSRRMDLNLLVVLDALLSERNVSRVAERLHLTQPAVSHALARARQALNDPLMLRQGGSMVPTPKGLRLQAPLHQILSELDRLLQGVHEFDPLRVNETILIGVTDYGDFVVMPAVIAHLRRTAPGLSVVIRTVVFDQVHDDLASGRIDMVVAFATAAMPGMHEEVLFEESYMVVASVDFGGEMTLDRYLAADHVQVSHSGLLSGGVDDTLRKLDLQRRVVLATPHFMTAAAAAARTQLLMTTPSQVAHMLMRDLPLRGFAPPFGLPRITFKLSWHPRTHLDPVQAWVRGVLRDVVAGLGQVPAGRQTVIPPNARE